MAARYAIYFAPERDTRLWSFGTRLLGRDPETGEIVPQLVPDGIRPEDWQNFTAAPRRYGFHATLKAPFALVADRTESQLLSAVEAVAARLPPVSGLPLWPEHSGSYCLLGLPTPDPRVIALADTCVEQFDRFREPLTEAERTRRLKAGLDAREQAHLDRWGYPYVFDTFTFHMSLAGPLPPARIGDILAAVVAVHDAEVNGEELAIRSLSVFVEPGPGEPFRLARRFPLGG